MEAAVVEAGRALVDVVAGEAVAGEAVFAAALVVSERPVDARGLIAAEVETEGAVVGVDVTGITDAVVAGATKQIALSDYQGKYVVLFFYPLSHVCNCNSTRVINAFSDAAAKFQQIDCELIGCNVDSVFSHLQWVNTERKTGGLGGCNFPLVSDLHHY
jgi:hypothetical protein